VTWLNLQAGGIHVESGGVGKGVVLHVSGDLDLLTTPTLTDALDEALGRSRLYW